jgi:uncharacterized protein (TIGR00369 family)
MQPKMTPAQMEAFFDREFPQIHIPERVYHVEDIGYLTARIRVRYAAHLLRPGGTISGPTMMSLADFALYVAILGAIGEVALAVTTNLNINFLTKPEQKDLIGEAKIIKLGKRLAVGEVRIFSEGSQELCAHVTGTYSIPPR